MSNTLPTIKKEGAFLTSLKRNNTKIRDDRAAALGEIAELAYKRTVEDLEFELKQLVRDRDNMLDLSPTHADSLVLASDFNVKEFVTRDLDIGVKIRNLEIRLKIARERYNHLFTIDQDNNKEAGE